MSGFGGLPRHADSASVSADSAQHGACDASLEESNDQSGFNLDDPSIAQKDGILNDPSIAEKDGILNDPSIAPWDVDAAGRLSFLDLDDREVIRILNCFYDHIDDREVIINNRLFLRLH